MSRSRIKDGKARATAPRAATGCSRLVEPGASATNDRRPEFQHMIEAGISKPAPFDVVVVHSSGVKSATGGVRSSVLDWRKGCPVNPIGNYAVFLG
jgi:hypothetical protein